MSITVSAYFPKKPRINSESLSGDGWVLNIDGPHAVVPHDIPTGIRSMIGRCRWMVEINLEGETDTEALATLTKITECFIADQGARLYDHQENTIRDADGVHSVVEVIQGVDEGETLCLVICFENANRLDANVMGRLLDILRDELPEALPHRYGHFEPPEWRWDRGGKEAYLQRWKRQDIPISFCKTPVIGMYMTCDPEFGREVKEFRCGNIEIQFRTALSKKPEAALSAMKTAERISVLLDAFYAALIPTDSAPGPFWKGIPSVAHRMMILGPPMLQLWPGFDIQSRPLGQYHRVAIARTPSELIRPPADLSCPQLVQSQDYASSFPFDKRDPYTHVISH